MKNYFLFLIFFLGFIVNGQILLENPDSLLISRANENVEVASLLVKSEIDFFNVAEKFLQDGILFRELSFKIEKAKKLNIYFDKFFIGQSSTLSIISLLTGEKIIYNQSSNLGGGLFAVPPMEGDEIKLIFRGAKNDSEIKISEVGYFWKSDEEVSSSGFCEVDVNCSEGDNWQDQKNGVVRLLMKKSSSTVYCSGSLLNNSNRDCKPYVFSAEHCLEDVSSNNLKQSFAYFNFEASVCGAGDGSTFSFLLGMTHIASTSFNAGSDFLLLELDDEIPLEFNAYYNGWNIENGVFLNGVSIHHPKGDEKKISTYDSQINTPILSGMVDDAFWEVNWVETNNGHGVTETGSSGSPLFNQEKLVIGALSAGTSYCTKPEDPDYYGKISYAWDNELDSSKRLDVWLNPLGLSETNLTGSYFPCNDTSELYLPINSVVILGNPVVGPKLKLYVEQKLSSEVEINVFSINGKIVFKEKYNPSNIFNIEFPVAKLANGNYFVNVSSKTFDKTLPFVILNI